MFRKRNDLRNELVYPQKVKAMCASNLSSLEVSYVDIGDCSPILAIWLADVPRDILKIFDEVLKQVVEILLPGYVDRVAEDFHVRIIELPLADKLRDLRHNHLNSLIRVNGVVTRRTGVFPQMLYVAYDCVKCGNVIGPFPATIKDIKPSNCSDCNSTGPFRINSQKTEYGNYQKITLQESPGTVPPGRVPRYKEVILLGDLTDIARPGEEVEVTGIYIHSQVGIARDRSGFPVFGTIIEANCVRKKGDTSTAELTAADIAKIKEMSQDPQVCYNIYIHPLVYFY
jgi:DNA replication licensing factor MCM2